MTLDHTHELRAKQDKRHDLNGDCSCGHWSMTIPAKTVYGDRMAALTKNHALHLQLTSNTKAKVS